MTFGPWLLFILCFTQPATLLILLIVLYEWRKLWRLVNIAWNDRNRWKGLFTALEQNIGADLDEQAFEQAVNLGIVER